MASTTVVKKTIRRVVTSDGKEDVNESVSTERHSNASSYQLYRGMSPTTQNRLENRVNELEISLEQERAAHIRTQTEVTSVHIEIQTLYEKLELAEKEIATQIDLVRRRDQDLLKAKKENELLTVQYEASETSLKKRFQDQLNDLNEALDRANKAKAKIEKDKQELVLEAEGLNMQIDEARKAKLHVESKVESLEDLIRQLRLQAEELTKSNQELVANRARLTQENSDMHRQLQDIETRYSSVSQSKTQIQQKLDVANAKVEEERRLFKQLETQFLSITADFERARSALDEQSQEVSNLQAQLQKVLYENQSLKVRYDKDVAIKVEEFEDLRRKTAARISELETQLEQSKTKITRLEKEKSKLIIQLEEVTVQFEAVRLSLNEHVKLLKQAETTNATFQKRVDELCIEVQSGSNDVKRLQTELIQSKQTTVDQQTKIESLTKENRKLSDSAHELEIKLKELSRQQQELSTIRIQLQSERDSLQTALSDARETIHALELKLESSSITLNQLKIDMENAISCKSDEIENIRKSTQRTTDELHLQITELEFRIKTDTNRWKKKMESEYAEYHAQIDALNRNNVELAKVNKNLIAKLKDSEALLEAESKTVEHLTESVTVSERKFIALQTELEEVRIQLTAAEKARKNAEADKATYKTHITEINVIVQNLTVEKRRLESDLAANQREFDDAVNARKVAEERAEKLAWEVSRLNDQIRIEQSNVTNAESKSKQLETKVRELTLHIEQLESIPDGKKKIAKLQLRVSDLERELDLEQRNGRELTNEVKKLQRQLCEIRKVSEDEHRSVLECKETIRSLELRMTALKRQLQDSEEMVGITLAKYRKTQQLLEDAERRADKTINIVHHKTTSAVSATGGGNISVRQRSYSVTRETSNKSTSHSWAY